MSGLFSSKKITELSAGGVLDGAELVPVVQNGVTKRVTARAIAMLAAGEGGSGWSPVFAVATDGVRCVLQVTDWTGGTGTKPTTGYVGASGIVANIAQGVDVRGAEGPQGEQGEPGEDGTEGGAAWGTITGTLSSQTDLNTVLGQKVDAQTFVTLAGTTWDVGAAPLREQNISSDTDYTLTGGTNGVARGVLIVTNTGSYTVTINGSPVHVRANSDTAISVVKKSNGAYYISSDYTPATAPTPQQYDSLDFTGSTGMESAGGLNWRANAAVAGYGNLGKASKKIAAGTNGCIITTYDGTANGVNFGLYTSNSEVGYATMVAALAFQASTTTVLYIENGGGTIGNATTSAAAGDRYRIRRNGSTLTIERSTDEGATWSAPLYTFAYASAADLFVVADSYGKSQGSASGLLVNPQGQNLV